jgi:hypothetical protein
MFIPQITVIYRSLVVLEIGYEENVQCIYYCERSVDVENHRAILIYAKKNYKR